METSISLPDDRVRRGDWRVWVLGMLAAVALGLAGLAVSRSSMFHARGIEVIGVGHLSRADVIELAGVSAETNVVWLDEGAVERRLESHPWIRLAEVHAALPWTIQIRVLERSPVAVAVDGDRRLLVAGDGTVLGLAALGRDLPPIELPSAGSIEGPRSSPAGAARILGAMDPALRARVRQAIVGIDGTVEIWLGGGIRVRFGSPAEPARKALALDRVLRWAEGEGQRLRSVSVVAPDTPAASLAT